jgi:hypothetical protein
MDASDQNSRFNGAGLILDDGTNLNWRQNVAYTASTQSFLFATVSSGPNYYEIHTEPLLHGLNNWGHLINEGLRRIRRISLQQILLTGRGYYDLTDWSNISGVSQFRRLYLLGSNLILNGDFDNWPTADNGPGNWTTSDDLTHADGTVNYAYAVTLAATDTMYQDIPVSGARRIKVSCWGVAVSGGTGTLKVEALLTSDVVERTSTTTVASTTNSLISTEIETTENTVKVRVTFTAATQAITMWSPMAHVMSRGTHQRIQPVSCLLADRKVRLWTPKAVGVGEMALLLPEAEFTLGTTDALDIATVDAPYELAKASIIVQVLRFLVQHPEIPSASKREYIGTLSVWQTTFNNRIREHHRKLAKSTSVWEAGELN